VDFIESLGNVEAHMSKNTRQMNTFIRGLYYWSKAYCIPGETVDVFRTDREKLLVSFWINLTFAFLYSISALLGYLAGQEILIDPWVPVGRESYYRYQVFLAILWGLVTWIMLAGICHLLALVGKGPDNHMRMRSLSKYSA
jgi:hypothetical protein